MKRQAIESLLPSVYRRAAVEGSVLSALIDVMQMLHEPSIDVLARVDAYFDPRRAPDAFIPYLGQWVDLDRFYDQSFRGGDDDLQAPISPGLARLRELIHFAAHLSRWRGTHQGLIDFLQVATGVVGFEVSDQVLDDDGSARPFHIRVSVPEAARVHLAIVRRIIESEKPAYVTYDHRFHA